MRALPPFDALVAFDTALRLRSMTLAAAELGITQSAISHRLRRLEGFVGAPLLNRSGAGLDATPAGTALAAGLAELLDGLADLRARCRRAIAPAGLRVGVGSALADYWLVRRLPGFAAAHPGIAIELAIVDSEAQARAPDVDVQVLWMPAGTARAASTQRLLFEEQVFPVCHPRLLPGGRTLADPADLAGLPLLHKGLAGRTAAEWSWPVWFERLALSGAPPAALRFGTIGTAITAALQGAGAVLARSLLVHDALTEGRLVRVLPAAWDMPSSKAHIVRWPAALTGDPRVRDFVAWLAAEADKTVGE
ncbi:MAG: LysR family transcriptional regulator [Rhizobiales bacterium]|nr:LysR family transcriptional regulator [Hyphomicrobiales bacterium]